MIKKIKIENFLSIQEVNLNLESYQLCVIDGINKDEGGKSNGSGKTALIEAIRWCILGDPGLERDTPIKHGAEAAIVTLELDFRGRNYVLQRTRRKKEVFDFWMDDLWMTEGLTATEAQRKFTKYFDIDPEVFLTLFVVDGNTIQSFCNYNSSERIAIVNKYFRNDRWDLYKDRADNAFKDLDREHVRAEGVRDSLLASIIRDPGSLTKRKAEIQKMLNDEYYPYRKRFADYCTKVATYNSARAAEKAQNDLATSQARSIKDDEDELTTLAKRVESSRKTIETLRNEKVTLDKKQKELEQLRKSLNSSGKKLSEFEDKVAVVRLLLEKVNEYIRILEDSKATKQCEICGSKITSVAAQLKKKKAEQEKVESKISDLEKEEQEERYVHDNIEKEVRALDAQVRDLDKRVQVLSLEEGTLKQSLERIELVKNRLAESKKKVIKQAAPSKLLPPTIGEFRGREYTMAELDKEIETLTSEQAIIEERLKKSKEAEQGLIAATKKLEDLEKQMEVYRFWGKAFGKYGIPIRVLDNFLPLVQERTNQYLGDLNSSFRIELRTLVPRKKDDGYKEKMEIVIKNTVTGAEFTLRSNSRGEVKSIATVLFLAFNSIVRDREGFEFNVLLLDEVFDGLDKLSRGMVFNLISRIGEGFQIFATSHYGDVNDKFQQRLLCVKEKGTTEVQEG